MAQIFVCDICGSRENVVRKQYPYKTEFDGVETSSVYEVIDLCSHCENIILQKTISNFIKNKIDKFEFNSLFIKEFKSDQY